VRETFPPLLPLGNFFAMQSFSPLEVARQRG
jgi:hypothetical protein